MANYDWRNYTNVPWSERFPATARGSIPWRQQASVSPRDFRALATRMMDERQKMAAPTRPCLFVSHRQVDVKPALRIAYLACQQGFEYWLDILDPTLTGIVAPTAEQTATATAAAIEMALLNSSHVVAVMTLNTKGSEWVPYEYGRVKAPVAASPQAACWIDKTLTGSTLPYYLYLGPRLQSESEINQWLRTEFQNSGYGAAVPCGWKDPIPSPL